MSPGTPVWILFRSPCSRRADREHIPVHVSSHLRLHHSQAEPECVSADRGSLSLGTPLSSVCSCGNTKETEEGKRYC